MMDSVAENLALYIYFVLLYRLTTLVFVQAIPCLRVLELEWIDTVFDLRLCVPHLPLCSSTWTCMQRRASGKYQLHPGIGLLVGH